MQICCPRDWKDGLTEWNRPMEWSPGPRSLTRFDETSIRNPYSINTRSHRCSGARRHTFNCRRSDSSNRMSSSRAGRTWRGKSTADVGPQAVDPCAARGHVLDCLHHLGESSVRNRLFRNRSQTTTIYFKSGVCPETREALSTTNLSGKGDGSTWYAGVYGFERHSPPSPTNRNATDLRRPEPTV